MAKTKIADIIKPEVFNPYVIQKTAELSEIYRSGIISTDPAMNKNAAAGGDMINMPYWNDLTGDSQILSDDGSLVVNKITSGKDMARMNFRGNAWSVNDLAKYLSGDDPMGAIGDLVAEYWARDMQKVLLSVLKGIFAAGSMSGNLSDISKEVGDKAVISTGTFLDAKQKLGDSADKLTAVLMHSAVYTALQKNGAISFKYQNAGGDIITSTEASRIATNEIPMFQGKRVIVDDGCPVNGGVYSTYLFGQGAIGYADGQPDVPTETDRDSLAGDDVLVNRKHFILHPRGIKWTESSVAAASPTNAEIATAANWERVYENKNIRIVEFKHKIA